MQHIKSLGIHLHSKLKKLLDVYNNDINILYVEDCENTRKAAVNILKNYFTNIDTAQDGQEGLDMFKKKDPKYDLIITDLDMPKVDGISMIKKIRETDRSIYIVVFSVHGDAEYLLKTVNLGIDGYLLKPFKINQFIDMSIKFMEHLNDNLKITAAPIKQVDQINIDHIKLYGGYSWNNKNRILFCNDKEIKLTSNEKKFFECLTTTANCVKSADELGTFIYDNYDIDDNSKLRNLIAKLKHKIDSKLIESSYGIGYKLKTY